MTGVFVAVFLPWVIVVVVSAVIVAALFAGRAEPFARRAARRDEPGDDGRWEGP